jgi:hypothetical protein
MDLKKHFKNIILLKSFFQNFKGLMFKKTIDPLDCYILETNGIHTFFMKFPIDVVYLDKNKKVIKKIKGMKPFRFASLDFKCQYVLEFSNEDIIEKIHLGQRIDF